MEAGLNFLIVFGAGLASVLSPCVLPVVPIIVTGNGKESRMRPLLIVAGLSITFIAMGVLSTLFGAVIGPLMFKMEKGVGILIALLGILLMFGSNPFKSITLFTKLAEQSNGRMNGLVLGLLLGLIWIPCVGPVLSGVLALVAASGGMAKGILLLLVYSAGFSVPMLIAGYATHFFRTRFRVIAGHSRIINIASGLILVSLGLFIAVKGVVGFASF